MEVISIVKTVVHYFDVGFENGGFFLEFILNKMFSFVHRAVKQPANQSQREHIFAPQYIFTIHTKTVETFLCQCGKWRRNQCNRFRNSKFCEWVIRDKTCFRQVAFLKTVLIENDSSPFFHFFDIHFESGRVHSHEDIRFVAGSIYSTRTNVNLKARYATQSTLWSTNFSRIIRESRNFIADYG